MRPFVSALILLPTICAIVSLGQAPPSTEPTKHEIERAYKSKSGGRGSFVSGERWRIKEIRGWTLKFSHTGDEKYIEVLITKYRAIAKRNGSCAEYQITDTMIVPPTNP